PVTVAVHNLGGQTASGVLIRLFNGAPEAGGALIGSSTVPSVAAGAQAEVSFNWPTAGLNGPQHLVAIADPDNAIAEGSETNNRGERQVVVQDAALALSNPSFSPNGDGIKDDTEVFYRLSSPQPVEVRVLDAKG